MDAATLLDHFSHDLANIPNETKFMLLELQKKDLEYDKTLSKIENADSQLFKYIKQHGSLVRHPKEDSLNEEITKLLVLARNIQNDKILLANTALLNITKHASKFERDIRRGIETGTIENWDVVDEDIEMTEYLTINNSSNPININNSNLIESATPPLSGRSSSDVNNISKKINNSLSDAKTIRLPKKIREKTPVINVPSSSTDVGSISVRDSSTPTKRSEVTAGTIIKGINRRMLVNGNGKGNENGNGTGGDDDELYCFCQQVSYGAMVACDNPTCKYEWFHYDCVGLKEPPVGVWYCPDCRKDVKKDTKKDKKKKP